MNTLKPFPWISSTASATSASARPNGCWRTGSSLARTPAGRPDASKSGWRISSHFWSGGMPACSGGYPAGDFLQRWTHPPRTPPNPRQRGAVRLSAGAVGRRSRYAHRPTSGLSVRLQAGGHQQLDWKGANDGCSMPGKESDSQGIPGGTAGIPRSAIVLKSLRTVYRTAEGVSGRRTKQRHGMGFHVAVK